MENDNNLLMTMGKSFLEWANKFFISEERIKYNDYLTKYPGDIETCSFKEFCEKLEAYKAYKKLEFKQQTTK